MSDLFSELDLQAFAVNIATTALVSIVALVLWMLSNRVLKVLEARSAVASSLVAPLRGFLRYAIFLVALLLILSSYGVPIGNFWTFISTMIGLVAIGFVAVWSVLSNLSSSFLLLIMQPFRVGDHIRIVGEDVIGTVTEINFMFTTVRSANGNVFKVPNNQFFQKTTLRPADPEKEEGKVYPDEKESPEG